MKIVEFLNRFKSKKESQVIQNPNVIYQTFEKKLLRFSNLSIDYLTEMENNVGGGGGVNILKEAPPTEINIKFVDLDSNKRLDRLYRYLIEQSDNKIYKKIDSRKIANYFDTSRETIDNTFKLLVKNKYIENLDNNRIWRLLRWKC